MLDGVNNGAHVYFVHSYFAPLTTQTIAACSYGHDFTAIIGNKNFMGCQFHFRTVRCCGSPNITKFFGDVVMIIYPAIDLIDGAVVRLQKGDFDQLTKYSSSPVCGSILCRCRCEVAASDGAKNPENRQITLISKIIENTGLNVQVGGGIRSF